MSVIEINSPPRYCNTNCLKERMVQVFNSMFYYLLNVSIYPTGITIRTITQWKKSALEKTGKFCTTLFFCKNVEAETDQDVKNMLRT